MQTIIILGGGVGGVITANTLRKKLGKEHKIIVIDKELKHTFASSLLWVANGTRNEKSISKQLDTLTKKGIEFIHGNIENVNPQSKQVTVNGKTLTGDYLVISLGAEISDSLEIGNKGYNLYTPQGAEGFHNALSVFNEGKIVVMVTALPFKCPAAPYEAALLINSFLKKKGKKTNIEIYSPEVGPMGVAGKKLSSMVRSLVESKGVKYFPEHQVTSISENSISFKNDITTSFNLLAYVPKHQCPQVIKDTDLVDESGWVKITNYNTLETKHSGVYAIGDITNIPLVQGKPLPKAGVFAHYQAQTVANNIAVAITGKGTLKQFTGDGMCFIELGDGKAGFAKGNFYAEPMPTIKMFMPGYHWHLGKILFEKMFLSKWF
ncbi:MAG: FAD-dependent oxidoreductase [Salinivirgaceae bacterium]|nr:FAD-dependent oxidoreductase [Salinivirgaceae bacterium]